LIDSYKLEYNKKYYKLDKQVFHPQNFPKVAPEEAFKPPKVKKDKTRSLEKVREERRATQQRVFTPGKVAMVKKPCTDKKLTLQKIEEEAIQLESEGSSRNNWESSHSEKERNLSHTGDSFYHVNVESDDNEQSRGAIV